MLRKSVQLVICLAAIMLLFAVTESYASPSRMAGLNLTGPRAGFTRDYVNTYPFPVAINRYSNMMWAHLGSSGDYFQAHNRALGLFHEMGENGHYGVLGVTLREDSPQDIVLQSMGLAGASHQQFDIMWGRDFEQASVGFRFDMARSSWEDKETDDVTAPDEYPDPIGPIEDGWVNTWGIGGAVDYDLSEDAMLEVGGEVRKYTFQDDVNEVSDDGSMSFRVAGRVFYERSENKTMVPLVSFMKTDLGAEGSMEVQHTFNDLFAGVACNHIVNRDDLMVYGVGFRYRSWEHTQLILDTEEVLDDYSRRDLPVLFAALEHRFRDWLVGRGGASQALVSRDFNDEDTEFANTKDLWSDFDFALGIGLEFRNFTIDATLNQNYPFTGFWFVSGQETPESLFGQVSFTYTYD